MKKILSIPLFIFALMVESEMHETLARNDTDCLSYFNKCVNKSGMANEGACAAYNEGSGSGASAACKKNRQTNSAGTPITTRQNCIAGCKVWQGANSCIVGKECPDS